MKYVFIILILLLPQQVLAYWSCAWPYRTAVTIDENSGTNLSDYQVQLSLSGSVLNGAYNWSSDGFDMRVVDSDDETLMNFWLEDWDEASETATIWVRLDTLPANSSKTIYLYYGNEFADTLANVPFTFVEPGIKFHTRNVSSNPADLNQAFSLFNGADDNTAGYGCTFITDFNGITNQNEFGSFQNFIAYSETYFEVQAGEEGSWGIRYGSDFGGGGGLYVNGTALEEDWSNDLWWNNNWGNADVLQGTINLTAGYHKLEIIGQEGCCDGGLTVQFQKPGEPFVNYSTANIDIRSRACPIIEPTVTFGAQATGSCPAALAHYRLDEGGWSGSGDVIDQSGSFAGTMIGSINEIENTQVCDGAEVVANFSAVERNAIESAVDLDGDVGAVGSIAFWLRLNNDWNDGTRRKIVDASLLTTGSIPEKYFFIDKLADGSFLWEFEDSNDSDFRLAEPTLANRNADQWYFITLTFDFPNDSFQIYVDETLVASDTIDINLGGVANTNGSVNALNLISFGDKNNTTGIGGTGNSIDGVFDEISIFNSVLSISEIRGLMAQTRSCSDPVLPRACLGSFPNAVNSIRNRIINFGENAQIIDNPDNILSARVINKTSFSTLLTCDTLDCITGDDEVNDVRPSNFQRTNAHNDETANFQQTIELGNATNEFDVLTANFQGTINFTNNMFSEFFIDSLVANSSSVINFAPGTYWINDFNLGSGARLNVLDGGPVRLYINDVVSWSSDTLINSPSIAQPGNADELLMYFYSSVNLGFRTTITGAIFATQDIDSNQESRFFGLVTGENVTLGLNSKAHYDVTAYYGMADITWCDAGETSVGSVTLNHGLTGINCLPSQIDVTVFDDSGAEFVDYEGPLTLSNALAHGDWTLASGAAGSLQQNTADSGMATYNMVAADGGKVTLYLRDSYDEIANISVTADGIAGTGSIDFNPAGFAFSTIPSQQAGLDSSPLTLSAVETDGVTGSCQSLLLNTQNIEMALECINPSNCGTANGQIDTTDLFENLSGAVNSYGAVPLDFGDASDYDANFNFNYDNVGQLRLYARYELLDQAGMGTGNFISGSSNSFTVIPAGFCIQPSEANWPCTVPGFSANCSAFKQAGQAFDFDVTAKAYEVSGDYCSANTVNNFTGPVDLSHSLIAPSGGDAGSFSLASVTLNGGSSTGNSAAFSDMGVFTLEAGGNAYLGADLPTNSSANIGRFYPKDFYVMSTSTLSFSNANVNGSTGFTYTGQTTDGLAGGEGAINYVMPPSFNFVVRGFNNQTLKNYLAPFNSTPIASLSASSNTLGIDGVTPLTVTAGFNVGSFNPLANGVDEFSYTLSSDDHFLFERNGNSLRGPFTNDIIISIDNLIEVNDGLSLANPGSVNFNGSGGEIRYGRLSIENAYGPETQPVPQMFKTEYFNGNGFILNVDDNDTPYDLTTIVPANISVVDVGSASAPLLNTDSNISDGGSNTGFFNGGQLSLTWSVPLNGHYGMYQFFYDAPNYLIFNWDNASNPDENENPSAQVSFGQYRGHDEVIYWKEINY